MIQIGLIYKSVVASIPKIFQFIKDHIILVLIIVILLLLGLHLLDKRKIQNLQYQQKLSDQNIACLMDSIRITKNKNGDLESSKLALTTSVKDLKKLNKDLSNELEKEKGNVKTIVKTEIRYVGDTVTATNTKVTDSSITFEYSRIDTVLGSRYIEGIATKKNTKITRDEIAGLKLVTGIKERSDKLWEIFIRTKYPGITFSKIEGAIIDPAKAIVSKPPKKLGIGFNVSWSPVRCDISGQETNIKLALKSASIGIGIQYNIFSFF